MMQRVNLFLIYLVLILPKVEESFSQSLPIKSSRTISLTTDEGTSMDIDISPNGNTIVFDLLGDLFTIPVTGGNTHQLTRGLARNGRPVWSPDGTRLAYISDRSGANHLTISDAAGTFLKSIGLSEEQLQFDTDPIWSPDGRYIMINGATYNLAGTKVQSLISNIGQPLKFSQNGQLLYYLDSAKLCRIDLINKSKVMIAPYLNGYSGGALSADGKYFAYITDSNNLQCLVLHNYTNNTERLLVPSLLLKYPLYKPTIHPRFTFSPDSRSLFIGYGGKIHRINIESGLDEVIPFHANVKTELGTLNYNKFRTGTDSLGLRYFRSANRSPDGRHLAFSALNKIFVLDLPNGKPHLLVSQAINQFQPVYSPDGKSIAYVSWCDSSGGDLWCVPSSGGKPRSLTHAPGQYQRPAWSPDGKSIAVIRGAPQLGDRDDPGVGEVEIIPLNGGPITVVDANVPLWNRLTYSADGASILYAPNEHFLNDTCTLLVKKNLLKQTTTIAAVGIIREGLAQKYLLHRTISPDNRFLAYSLAEDLYLVPVSDITKPTMLINATKTLPMIRFARGVDLQWEKNGKVLSWCYGNYFYSASVERIYEAAKKKKLTTPTDTSLIDITPALDEAIELKITVPRFHATGTIALSNARIITMKESEVIDHGVILIRNGRIVAVGQSDKIQIPQGSKELDLSGTTVIPGFIDMHLHMRVSPDIFPQQSWMFLVNLAYGVTTARDPSGSFDQFGYGELVESGQMIGPRLYTVGRAVRLLDEGILKLNNIDDARSIVRKRALLGATAIKQYTLPDRAQRQNLLIASKESKLNMTNEGDFDPLGTIAMIKDGSTGVEHSPIWGDAYSDITSFITKSGCYFTPTLVVNFGQELTRENSNFLYWHYPYSKLLRFTPDYKLKIILNAELRDTANKGCLYPSIIAAQIRHDGGNVVLGSHGDDEGIGVHNELWALQNGGLTNLEALRAATIMGARGLGLQDDIGSIEVGKLADLIILTKNPIDDIHNSREILYVMKNGVLYDGETLNSVWPSKSKCPEWRLK